MVLIDCTHWAKARLKGSFVLLTSNDMNTKQVVAVIGASGEMGYVIAKSIANGNYRIVLQSPDANQIRTIADNIKSRNPFVDLDVVDSALDACWEADIVVLAVPYAAEKEVVESIKQVTNQKIVISISNPINDAYNALTTIQYTSAAEKLQEQLPHAKVIKAFNMLVASDFNQPVIDGQRTDCFIAGNDEDALEIVYDLVKTVGFNPVIAGDLTVSRTLESM
jgi:8-hydroxy-5-deazaflavin:NADPH oxidoreductase